MSDKTAFVLDEHGVARFNELIEDYLRRRQNAQMQAQQDFYYKTQDVFIALVPDAGIPGRSDHTPGSAVCSIYYIDTTLKLYAAVQQTVYNLNSFPIISAHQTSTGTGTMGRPLFIPIVKDKYGIWLAMQYPAPFLAKMQRVGTGTGDPEFGQVTSANYHLWSGASWAAPGAGDEFDTGISFSQVTDRFNIDDGAGFAWLGYNPGGNAVIGSASQCIYVIQANHFADVIWGTTAGSLSSGGSVNCNVTGYTRGLNPGSTVMVNDVTSDFDPYPIASGTIFKAERVTGNGIPGDGGSGGSYMFTTLKC